MFTRDLHRSRLIPFFAASLLIFIGACSSPGVSSSSSSNYSSGVACIVSSVAQVTGTNEIVLGITATGGSPNYTVSSVNVNSVLGTTSAVSFASSTSLTETFSSLTASTLSGATGTVSGVDANNSAFTCSFTIAAGSGSGSGSGGSTGSNLACTILPSPTTATAGVTTVNFSFAGSGGTSPYTFSNFNPGGGATGIKLVNGTTTGSDSAIYPTAGGPYQPTVRITDVLGNEASCSYTSVTVNAPVTTTAPANPCGVMTPNQVLTQGQSIYSCNGLYEFTLQTDGNLVFYGPNGPKWATGTNVSPNIGSQVRMQSDGNLVLASAANAALFTSTTSGNPGAYLAIQNDGNLVIYSATGKVLWVYNEGAILATCGGLASGAYLANGQSVVSCAGGNAVSLLGGNLILKNGGANVWATNTNTGNVLLMQTDGNLVLYDVNNHAIWSSGTSGQPGATMAIQTDGNLVVYNTRGIAVWSVRTGPLILPCGVLASGQAMGKGLSVWSCSGVYELTLQSDGNLVLYGPSGAIWWTGTTTGNALLMQTDGNLVLYDVNSHPVWSSGSYGFNGSSLAIQGDGNLVVYNTAGQPVWDPGVGLFILPCGTLGSNGVMRQWQSIYSCSNGYRLTLQGDGNLVEYNGAGTPIWASNTNNGAYLVMQAPGNLVLYASNNVPVWYNATYGIPGSYLSIQADGNLVVYWGTLAAWSRATGQLEMPCGGMTAGQVLYPNQFVMSCNFAYRLTLQGDGNLVLYATGGGAIWNTGTTTGAYLAMQVDGNLVLYDASRKAIFNTVTYNHPGASMQVQNNGYIVVYGPGGKALWDKY